MNERIKELAEQADIVFGFDKNNDPEVICAVIDIEKFAELIVQECVNVLHKAQWDKGEDWECADGTRIIAQVKHHFGVEE